jgi:hypothetical protein
MMRKIQAKELLDVLENALRYKKKRRKYLLCFEEMVGECEIVGVSQEQLIALEDLACDFAYYTTDEQSRREDPALFGDEEMEKRIRETFTKGNW